MLEDCQRWFSYLLVLSSLVNTSCAFSTGHCLHQASTTTATCSSLFGVASPLSSLWRARKNVYNGDMSLRKQMAANSENESSNSNEELEDLYRTVAENDSDWYKEFVLDVLGEEAAVKLPPPSPIETKNTKEPESLSSPIALDEESDKNGEEIVMVKEETNEATMETTNDQKPIVEDNVLSDEIKLNSDKASNEKIATILDKEAASEAAVVSSQQGDTIDNRDAANPADDPPKRTRVKSVVEAEVDEIVGSIKHMLGGGNTEQQVQTSDFNSDSKVDDEPKKNVVKDKDIGTNGDDDLDDMADKLTMEEKQSSIQDANVGSSEPTQSEKEQASSAKTTSSDDKPIVTDKGDDSNDDGANSVVQFRNLFTGQFQSVPLKILLKLGYEQNEIPYLQPDALELIVEEQISKPRIGIPPQWKITESQYKALPDDVRIVPQAEASLIEEEQNRKKSRSDPSNNRSRRQDADIDELPEIGEQRNGQTDDLEQENRRPRKRPTSERRESTENKRRRIPTNDDEDGQNEFNDRPRKSRTKGRPSRQGRNASGDVDERRIYTGRDGQKRRKKRSGPAVARRQDPPGNRFWPGMDTFRGLLATESEMRLRILGREWTDVVRDEADWRLDTYKNWLEMLDEGVGTPIMESRSDRDRKVRSKYVVTESPPKMSERKPRRREQEMDIDRENRRPGRRSNRTEQRRRTRSESVEDSPTNPGGERRRRRVNDSSERRDSRPRRPLNDPTLDIDPANKKPRRRRPRNDESLLQRKETNVSRRRPQVETEWDDDM